MSSTSMCGLTECRGNPMCPRCVSQGDADALRLIDLEQVIYALQRAERRLQAEADALSARLDYAAEFPAEDADRMREAITLLRAKSLPNLKQGAPVPHNPSTPSHGTAP